MAEAEAAAAADRFTEDAATEIKTASKASTNLNEAQRAGAGEVELQELEKKQADAVGDMLRTIDPTVKVTVDPASLQEAFKNPKVEQVYKGLIDKLLDVIKSYGDIANDPAKAEAMTEDVKSKTTNWEKVSLILKVLAAIGAGVGIWELLNAIAEKETGCHQVNAGAGIDNGPIKDGWLGNEDNCNAACASNNCVNFASSYCPCTQQDANSDCGKAQASLQCDYTKGNYAYYWTHYNAWDVATQIPAAAKDLVNNTADDIFGALKDFKWVFIGVGIFIVVCIIGYLVFGHNRYGRGSVVVQGGGGSQLEELEMMQMASRSQPPQAYAVPISKPSQ